MTPEEYLEIERAADHKSEYYDGIIYAMSGVKKGHDMITGNVHLRLRNALAGKKCQVHTSDMRIRTVARHYTYPDVSATCGEPQYLDTDVDTFLNPSLIVEVLSVSTEPYDRGKKFELYRSISSFREYLLLASDRMEAEIFIRRPDGDWTIASFHDAEDVITIDSLGCKLKLGEIYEDVVFDPGRTGGLRR